MESRPVTERLAKAIMSTFVFCIERYLLHLDSQCLGKIEDNSGLLCGVVTVITFLLVIVFVIISFVCSVSFLYLYMLVVF